MHPSLLLAAVLLAPPSGGVPVLPAGAQIDLKAHLQSEAATLFLFYRPESSMERSLADELSREWGLSQGVRLIRLRTGDEPAARQHGVTETPLGIVFDRRGRQAVRSTDPAALKAAMARAAGQMRIDWADDDDPRIAEIRRLTGAAPGRGIMRTLSLRPEWLALVSRLAREAHFSEGALDRRTKELIATHVSQINKCRY